jgi:hypothetical protein
MSSERGGEGKEGFSFQYGKAGLLFIGWQIFKKR